MYHHGRPQHRAQHNSSIVVLYRQTHKTFISGNALRSLPSITLSHSSRNKWKQINKAETSNNFYAALIAQVTSQACQTPCREDPPFLAAAASRAASFPATASSPRCSCLRHRWAVRRRRQTPRPRRNPQSMDAAARLRP
jgi:hypothetical protein